MCLAIPMQIEKIKGTQAIVNSGGLRKTVDVSMVEDIEVGDYILIHAGFAIQKIDEKDAKMNLELWKELKQS